MGDETPSTASSLAGTSTADNPPQAGSLSVEAILDTIRESVERQVASALATRLPQSGLSTSDQG